MISWMQKHKKYLVITIWISTIAFVGAGFVGWGAYKFGASGDTLAKVGEAKITVKEYNKRYSELYDYYRQRIENFDDAKAKEMGLDKIALNDLLQEAMLEALAKEFGLEVSDEEVARQIASMPYFQKDGKFDKELYLQILKQNRLKPKEFEASVKKDLLIAKLKAALAPKTVPLEFDTLASGLYIADKIEYKPLSGDELEIRYSQEDLKKYFDSHRQEYKTPKRYKIALLELPVHDINASEEELRSFYEKNILKFTDNEGKKIGFEQARERVLEQYRIKKGKKEALRKYIELKKGKIQPSRELTLTKSQIQERFGDAFAQRILKKANQIALDKKSSTIKPVYVDGRYLIAQIESVEPPRPLTLQEALPQLKKAYEQELKKRLLIQKAKELAKNFKGKQTPFITREDIDKIHDLQPQEAALFLRKLFVEQEPQGYIQLGDNKVVLYKILDQKLGQKEKIEANKERISATTQQLKARIQDQNLLQYLQHHFKIELYKGLSN
ncbi:MAG: hypothetical protein C6H99_03255 [Epsilonproteobacteria bacterium]|nr:hypothetical protein [Campylobacterota bacterium]NPA63479.1 hypothetical protein [Campylobacterota bacterium]